MLRLFFRIISKGRKKEINKGILPGGCGCFSQSAQHEQPLSCLWNS